MIIVVEGTDGSGKQTQTNLLFDYLKGLGLNVKMQSFPNYESESSILVKKYLNGDYGDINALTPFQASVFFSVDRLCTMLKYKDFLSEGGILLLDRYVSSNILHQASKIDDKTKREKFVEDLEHFEYENLCLPKPDITFFLDLAPEISKKLRFERGELKSGTKKDIHESNEKYIEHCYEVGCEVAKNKGWEIVRCFDENGINKIEDIQNKIRKVVKQKLDSINN
ncbi:MAG: dTMP kinase [Christensenellales bacterium]